MRATLGELRSYIRQRLVEVKNHYPQLQPGTQWITGVPMYVPESAEHDWRCAVKMILRGSPTDGQVARTTIPKGTEVEVIGRINYDRGTQERRYNDGYVSPPHPDITNTPVIQWQGEHYAVFGASPTDFIKPDADYKSTYTWNEAIVAALAQIGRVARPKDILAKAAEIRGLGGNINSGLYIRSAESAGLIKYSHAEGRSSYYELTDKGRELLAELEQEEQERNPQPRAPAVIRRRREEPE